MRSVLCLTQLFQRDATYCAFINLEKWNIKDMGCHFLLGVQSAGEQCCQWEAHLTALPDRVWFRRSFVPVAITLHHGNIKRQSWGTTIITRNVFYYALSFIFNIHVLIYVFL